MRLEPIESPKSILLKFIYFVSKKLYGKVLAPIKILYARSFPILFASNKILSVEKKLVLPKELRILIRNYVANLNGCEFCSNLQLYEAMKNSLEFQKVQDLLNFRKSDNYSPKEKAMLAYVEEVSFSKKSSDGTFAELQKYFSEREIVEITWMNASEHYFNFLGIPLELTSDELVKG
ncbi:carboxymuconolactone decarboxylase family protein [Leptospira perolatii]|uniref:carboxymuconolactone decarboxylase family protein n=1 Tax=Leptospira perolatii TaxID=2023191 RepID=UPI0013FDB997|nr:carboxymuconolactone decarboxylase family protein [Leptospira perolatii]